MQGITNGLLRGYHGTIKELQTEGTAKGMLRGCQGTAAGLLRGVALRPVAGGPVLGPLKGIVRDYHGATKGV